MDLKNKFTGEYIAKGPLALALERSYECHILSQQVFERPILDIGCGDGVFASILFKDNKIDTGIDVDQKELISAGCYGIYEELIACNAQKIPKKDKTYRTVFANSAIEHIEDIKGVLQEARRIMVDNGRMYITVPTDRFDRYTLIYQMLSSLRLRTLAENFRILFNRFWKHYHYYDRAGWEGIFTKNGFKIVQYREYNPKFNCLLNDALVPLSIGSFLSRKFLNRWFVFPHLRRFYTPALDALFSPMVDQGLAIKKQGGLIFFELRKVIFLRKSGHKEEMVLI